MVDSLTPLPKWADKVGLDYQTAYRMCRRGDLNAVQLSSRWYIINGGVDGAKVDEADTTQDSTETEHA